MTRYGPVDILWLDAGQVRPPDQDIGMDRLAAMARKHRPDLLIVDRTVGGKYEDYRTPEQEVPEKPLPYAWESCLTMGTQWSYKPGDRYKSARDLVGILVDIVAKGGNLLLDIGPKPDGTLPEEAVARLREIGAWMRVNGEAIHGSRPIAPYKSGRVALTRRGEHVHAISLARDGEEGPPARIVVPIKARAGTAARLLGVDRDLRWSAEGEGTAIEVPEDIAKSPPCRHAWTFRIEAE